MTIEIDAEKATVWGKNGGAGYYINDSGGLELTDVIDSGLADAELTAATKEIIIDTQSGTLLAVDREQ